MDVHDPTGLQLGSYRSPIVLEEIAQQDPQMVRPWQALGAAVLIPCLARDQHAGILALGEKRSGRLYTTEDLEIFFVLAAQLGLALENLAYLEAIKAAQEQLRQSDRLATAGRFAAAIAHEVKQPLTAITTFVETLPIRGDDAEFRAHFQAVVGGELQRMETTVRQLTDFARPQPPQRQRVDLRDIIRDAAALIQPECAKRGAELACQVPGPIEFDTDPHQIKQVLLNLALNGLDAMEATSWVRDRPRRLTISATADPQNVELSVTDSGCGLRPEEIPQIFEPFHTTKAEGTGLGLVVVKQIVEAHHGTIHVRSTYGQGTTFTVRLPRSGHEDSR
ncbi:MAG: hypothetical protein A3C53_07920 [Omnitrophica WOR_2 bacterium RIFCSPHIGHO2_02_FULL_68_15]|nr:MAG: hypothetical protein A3C53_07920 [Omnitrophica WOR_2 bacterium RIFCSPHIGHO2_02_FULL_68_15]